MHFTVDPQPKLNKHKTFSRLSKRYKNALRTLNLGRVSRCVLRTHANIQHGGIFNNSLQRLAVNNCFANLSILDVCECAGEASVCPLESIMQQKHTKKFVID